MKDLHGNARLHFSGWFARRSVLRRCLCPASGTRESGSIPESGCPGRFHRILGVDRLDRGSMAAPHELSRQGDLPGHFSHAGRPVSRRRQAGTPRKTGRRGDACGCMESPATKHGSRAPACHVGKRFHAANRRGRGNADADFPFWRAGATIGGSTIAGLFHRPMGLTRRPRNRSRRSAVSQDGKCAEGLHYEEACAPILVQERHLHSGNAVLTEYFNRIVEPNGGPNGEPWC